MPRRIARLVEDVDDETPLEVVQVAGGSGLSDTWYLRTFTGHAAVTPRFERIDRVIEDEERVDAEAAALIAALAPDRWSAEPVASFRSVLRAQREETGWFVGGEAEPKWREWFTVQALTREQAFADVEARAPVPPGWELFARARPADAG